MRSDRAVNPGQRYPPVAEYAFLANCHSAALVSRDASVDWACLRRFGADSVFGRILDWDRGGFFSVIAHGLQRTSRRYIGDALVLETTLETDTGVARIVDAFAMHRGGAAHPHNQLLRIIDITDYDEASGELLGNFPQAFTHTALINAAKNLGTAAAGDDETPWSSDRVERTR